MPSACKVGWSHLDGSVITAGEDALGGGRQSAHSSTVARQRGQALERGHVPHAHLHTTQEDDGEILLSCAQHIIPLAVLTNMPAAS